MGAFEAATHVEGGDGRYTAEVRPDWQFWGPIGGYLAGLVARAIADDGEVNRFASIYVQFLRPGEVGPAEIELNVLRSSSSTRVVSGTLAQSRGTVLAMHAVLVKGQTPGFSHQQASMPKVKPPEDLSSYEFLADNYATWQKFWEHVEGRPDQWPQWPNGSTTWRSWLRLKGSEDFSDPGLEAARVLLWMDLGPWNTIISFHDYPQRWVAPNLDLLVQFHQPSESEWLLADASSAIAAEGLVGATGRIWRPDGRLIASSSAQLICRDNPAYESQLSALRARPGAVEAKA
jgi:acyl-CoA thioesterase